MDFYILLAIFAITLLVGVLASMIGLGGGFLMVPIFVLIFDLPVKIAIGTSTLVVTFVGLSSAISYNKRKLIDYGLVIPLAIGVVLGAQIGAMSTLSISGDALKRLIGFIFISISIIMALRKEKVNEGPYRISKSLLLVSGLLIGAYSGLLGMGGGVLMVPLLNLLGAPIHFAVATSSAITFFAGFSGATRHLIMDQIDVKIGLVSSLGVIIGAQIGPKIAVKLESGTLKSFFALIIALIGVVMIIHP